MLLETQRAILTRIENLKGSTASEDAKPKVKEAESIKLPDFPAPRRIARGKRQLEKQSGLLPIVQVTPFSGS